MLWPEPKTFPLGWVATPNACCSLALKPPSGNPINYMETTKTCQCGEPVKLVDVHLGGVCTDCAYFVKYAAKILRKFGIEGCKEKQAKP